MRVFLTGGTGLVGSHVALLLRAAGHDVRALVRRGSDCAQLDDLGCALVEADLSAEPAALARDMEGCDAVVHAAALVGARASRERYHALNVAGTSAVLAAAASGGVSRAIHVSSVAVYGPISGVVTEERWQEQPIHPMAFYAWSKRVAEETAWTYDRRGGMRVTTVRPALIYGERDRHVAPRLDRITRLPVLPLPDGGRWTPPLVYAGNVARGIVAALGRAGAAGRAYNLAQDHRVPLRDIVRAWCAIRCIRVPWMPGVPGGAIEGGARAADAIVRILPGLELPGLTRPARLLRGDNPYDSSRARSELGWTEPVPLEEALRRTAGWLDARPGRTTNHEES
ncbi:MAG TPA: NAD(P)-dependent oxidoreductase [Longimicrobiales bacterium]|nr:NAD(P)-dependent oxidoreductase [Longimicrobiales bacterium]